MHWILFFLTCVSTSQALQGNTENRKEVVHLLLDKNEPCSTDICTDCADAKLLDDGCYSCVCAERTMDDMLLTESQWTRIQSWINGDVFTERGASVFANRWPKSQDGKVNIRLTVSSFIVDRPLHIKAIVRAINIINARTCIRLGAPSRSTNRVHFILGNGCYSFMGMRGGLQTLSIGIGCNAVGIVEHELYHALGFFHEQSRPDRNKYIKVIKSNIENGFEGNFYKQPYKAVDSFGSPYDKLSVMQYGGYYFSKNGKPTIIDREIKQAITIQRVSISKEDIFQLNKMYSCNGTVGVPLTIDCYHEEDYGHGYSGTMNISESGLPCQRWDATLPNPNQFSPSIITGARLAENYCRNPDAFDKPWCYVDSYVKVWEYCDIPECNDDLFMVSGPPQPQSTRLFWGTWSTWSVCNTTCGIGTRYRVRACAASNRTLCSGGWQYDENCTVTCDATWGQWKQWSSCSTQCGTGFKYRVRKCLIEDACLGSVIQERTCKKKCPQENYWKITKAKWRPFTSWSSCSVHCGGGKQYRTRRCKMRMLSKGKCFGNVVEERECNLLECNPTFPNISLASLSDETNCVNLSFPGAYRGKASTTVEGLECQYWDAQTPHRHNLSTPQNIKKFGLVENYCRVLSNDDLFPGCIPKSYRSTWSLCDIPTCNNGPTVIPEIGCFVPSKPYIGGQNTTKNGYTCQRWDKHHPHEHRFKPYILEYKELGVGQHNYCRNVFLDNNGPWCYTTDLHKRDDYCDVPRC